MSNCPVALIPIVTKRCSPTASLSSRVKACSSLNGGKTAVQGIVRTNPQGGNQLRG